MLCSKSESNDYYFVTPSIAAVAEVDTQFENEAQSCENDSNQFSCEQDVGDAVNDRENALDANCLQSLSPSQPPLSSTNIISSLEAALNKKNYDLLDLNPKEKKVYEASIEDKRKTGGKNIKWSNTATTSSGRQSAANVVRGDTGVVNVCRSISETRDAWEIFLRRTCYYRLFTTRTKRSKICVQNYC